MKDIGFTLVSTHAGADDIAKNGDQIIADAKTLGLKYVVCSSPGVIAREGQAALGRAHEGGRPQRLEVERGSLQQVRQAGERTPA